MNLSKRRLVSETRVGPWPWPRRSGTSLAAAGLGALALGALALGALALGALAIGALAVKSARIKRLEIGELFIAGERVRPGPAAAHE